MDIRPTCHYKQVIIVVLKINPKTVRNSTAEENYSTMLHMKIIKMKEREEATDCLNPFLTI